MFAQRAPRGLERESVAKRRALSLLVNVVTNNQAWLAPLRSGTAGRPDHPRPAAQAAGAPARGPPRGPQSCLALVVPLAGRQRAGGGCCRPGRPSDAPVFFFFMTALLRRRQRPSMERHAGRARCSVLPRLSNVMSVSLPALAGRGGSWCLRSLSFQNNTNNPSRYFVNE